MVAITAAFVLGALALSSSASPLDKRQSQSVPTSTVAATSPSIASSSAVSASSAIISSSASTASGSSPLSGASASSSPSTASGSAVVATQRPSGNFSASSFAGATSSAVYPPVNRTQSQDFPPGSVVGYPGPTPTGDEPNVIETAPAYPRVSAVFPLVKPINASQGNPTSLNGSYETGDSTFNPLRYWGQLSPFYSVPKGAFGLANADPEIPQGCSLTQVHLLHRHGARYPTSGSLPANFAGKLHNTTVNGTGFTATGDLAFLNQWNYKLGAEILTPFGRAQMFNLGIGFRQKYGFLLKNFTDSLPVFRTESEDRMLKSSLNFAAGFFGIPYVDQYNQEIIIESTGFNNTLAPYTTCNNSNSAPGNTAGPYVSNWTAVYLQDAVKRLQPQIKGYNLTVNDAYSMQQLCAYETDALGYSKFCDLFTPQEWVGYEYSVDLSFWYGNSFGNAVSSAMGLGWVQELNARLTKTAITQFNSTTNSTLHTPEYFPLNQSIYVDATHDTIISAIITALNFTTLAATGPLPTDHIPANRSFIVSQIAPFGANLQAQVVNCPGDVQSPNKIRFFLNDGAVPLTGLKGCAADPTGFCGLANFTAALTQRNSEINFNYSCFANLTGHYERPIITNGSPYNVTASVNGTSVNGTASA